MNRWVSDLTVFAEVVNSELSPDDVRKRVTEYVQTGGNPSMLRELRGDLSFDWRSEGGPNGFASPPIFEADGVKLFGPIRGVRVGGVGA